MDQSGIAENHAVETYKAYNVPKDSDGNHLFSGEPFNAPYRYSEIEVWEIAKQ